MRAAGLKTQSWQIYVRTLSHQPFYSVLALVLAEGFGTWGLYPAERASVFVISSQLPTDQEKAPHIISSR